MSRLVRSMAARWARVPLSGRAALAALVVYGLAGALLVVPLTTPWALVTVAGLALLVGGLRSGRVLPIGSALALAAGARAVRGASAGADASGAGGVGGVLVLALALAAVAELARLAVDAGARRGPVRIAPELRRRLRIDAALVAGLGTASTAAVLAATWSGWGRPPPALVPVGLLALPALLAALTLLAARTPPSGPLPAGGRASGGSGAHPGVATGRRSPGAAGAHRPGSRLGRRAALVVVVAAALALPTLAGLGGRAAWPDGDGAGPGGGTAAVGERPETPPETLEVPADQQTDAEEREPPSPPLGLVLGAGVAALGLALLLGGGEGLVSADDRRPDAVPAEESLRGAPTAPVVQALPPEELAAIVDDALGYLRAELEPRLAVRCAYAAVAGGLGRHDLARLPAETELEFLARQLSRTTADRGVGDGGALARLTDLFERARFSDRPVDQAMRADALAALEELRRELGGAAVPVGGATDRGPGRPSPGRAGGAREPGGR